MGRRQFSREFKLEAVRLVEERGVSVVQASRGRFRRHAEAVNTQRRPRPPLRGEYGEHVPKGNECRDQDDEAQPAAVARRHEGEDQDAPDDIPRSLQTQPQGRVRTALRAGVARSYLGAIASGRTK